MKIRSELFRGAAAKWDMADLIGFEDYPYDLESYGEVNFNGLEIENDREKAYERGSDGRFVQLCGGYLQLNRYRARRLRPKNNSLSIYFRANISSGDGGCLYYSDCIALSIHKSGLAAAFLATETKCGATYREIPLAHIKREGWSDIFLVVGDGELKLYQDSVLLITVPIKWNITAAFDDDIIIGGFRVLKPDTYGTAVPVDRFSGVCIDTVAIWDRKLSDEEIEKISCAKIKTEPENARKRVSLAYNEFFDASVERDKERCKKLWYEMQKEMAQDVERPAFHLSQPLGFIFDPCGAYFNDGKYHVFSYRNIQYLLAYAGLDHYVSDDLIHWYGYPISPMADSDFDVFGIYLMNHFRDENGKVRTLYTGQGKEGKMGILADINDDMTLYYGKHAVIKKYHHDGFVFRRDGKWYTITAKMMRNKRENGKGDGIMLLSSDDLENWIEESEIFTSDGFAEFPYLLNFGEKDLLIMGCRPVRYWIGKMDWESKKFIADDEIGKQLDYTNPFPCFNPLCVDNKGENGEERRIIMQLYGYMGSAGFMPWSCVHAIPRSLKCDVEKLIQEPVKEIAAIRRNERKFAGVNLSEGAFSERCGNVGEIIAEFSGVKSGKCGIRIKNADAKSFEVYFDAAADEFGAAGDLKQSGKGAAYQKGDKVKLHLLFDKRLVEGFCNGQSCTTAADFFISDDATAEFFAEESGCTADIAIWDIENSVY
ncbi:MAG: GH32 C-terminal domain-containing protein [Oscillospiraceae bacterium]|nr:GH32 C-terminal domain-containing protein [Oscillospiraceae bacterium]